MYLGRYNVHIPYFDNKKKKNPEKRGWNNLIKTSMSAAIALKHVVKKKLP
jgi:hypothetical protein